MIKKQVFFIHGGNAYSSYEAFLEDLRTKTIYNLPSNPRQSRWTDTLSTDLGEMYEVFAPVMPNKQNAHYEEGKIGFERHFEYLTDGVILIGWSQGGYFLSKYLIEHTPPFSIKALIYVAAPSAPDDFGGEDGGDFAFPGDRIGEIGTKVEKIFIFHSSDDPVVPVSHAERYQQALPNATLVLFNDKNHFLVPELPALVTLVLSL